MYKLNEKRILKTFNIRSKTLSTEIFILKTTSYCKNIFTFNYVRFITVLNLIIRMFITLQIFVNFTIITISGPF